MRNVPHTNAHYIAAIQADLAFPPSACLSALGITTDVDKPNANANIAIKINPGFFMAFKSLSTMNCFYFGEGRSMFPICTINKNNFNCFALLPSGRFAIY